MGRVVLEQLLESTKLQELAQALRKGDTLLIEELWNAPKALVASIAQKVTGKHVLILTGAGQEEARLFHDFPIFSERPCIDFPAWETLPAENIPPSPDIVGDRYNVLSDIYKSNEPSIILSSLQACLQKLILPKQFDSMRLEIKVGMKFPFDELIQKLTDMGYQRSAVASDKGEFAVRGGIIDVFPVSSPEPFRLDFWGDELETIRIYDPIGQKSIRPAEDKIMLMPARELELIQQTSELGDIIDYLGNNVLIIMDDIAALEDRYATLLSGVGVTGKGVSSIEDFLKRIEPLQKIYWTETPIESLSDIKFTDRKSTNFYSDTVPIISIEFEMFNRQLKAGRWRHPFATVGEYLCPDLEETTGEDILKGVERLVGTEAQLYFLCSSEVEEEHLQKMIMDRMIRTPKHTHYKLGYLSTGMVLRDLEWVILPMTEITHRYKIRRQKQRSTFHTPPSEVYDLTPGEYVVHLNNGIGKFLGLEKKPNHQGVVNEYFQIEYAEQSKLYVPLNQAYLISKYIGSGEEIPKMHALGSNRWRITKEKTQHAILGYAAELLDMYAKRSVKGGFAYPDDSNMLHDFEEDFPFIETEDQLDAIASIKEDMKNSQSMDRLICGDVGYGKTEVAMRAAFKAVSDGNKQVAVLVPTTVLAMQHYENFTERMGNFPVRIGVVSRFRTPKEIRDTLEKVANGQIDILIGTHRIISEDVIFKDLGLVIIDEEQRFGVKAKEHLKKIKVGVDCLTLSATPIPRTLYMSLVGARDMSVINTPPQDRLPIKTIISEPQDLVFKNALMRELARDGQAYVIHNRVETIFDMANRLQKLLPQARIVVGHGQMSSDEIDSVFHAFKSGRADILVATTIVENGIDIPNANTILIDRADRFGLADLYQMRGRVGRWNRRAYAYFLVPSLRVLPEMSRKRLNALAEASGYGGGMKVAMRDLEIRGAGNLLGTEQSGHVSSVGFHLYCKMLKRTIQTLQGKAPKHLTDTRMEIPIDARLPEEYVNEVSLRMEIYQRLGECLSFEDVDIIWEELQDRFGPPPVPAQWLYRFTRVRVFSALNGITLLKTEKRVLIIEKMTGKGTETRKMLWSLPPDPDQFETKLLALLRKEFKIQN